MRGADVVLITKNKQEVTDNFGHLQPQAVELEQAVLGALMIERMLIIK